MGLDGKRITVALENRHGERERPDAGHRPQAAAERGDAGAVRDGSPISRCRRSGRPAFCETPTGVVAGR